jgi:hypothetical protein
MLPQALGDATAAWRDVATVLLHVALTGIAYLFRLRLHGLHPRLALGGEIGLMLLQALHPPLRAFNVLAKLSRVSGAGSALGESRQVEKG